MPGRSLRLPALNLKQFRLRILFRGAFLLLAAATVGLALYVLQQEKQLSYNNYRSGLNKTAGQIGATLRHPTGQLALLNLRDDSAEHDDAPLHPVLLPYPSLDFDEQSKVQQAVTMSGCLAQYGDTGTLCVAVGSSIWAGGFIYVAGDFYSGQLVPHAHGVHELDQSHRVRVTVALRGETYRWIAPFEQIGDPVRQGRGMHGRLTGFDLDADGDFDPRPNKEFRGWVWQNPYCFKSDLDNADCVRSAFYSMRLPIPAFQKELMQLRRPVWPPADLDKIRVRIEVLAPGDGGALFDSDSGAASRPFAVRDLAAQLLPGETLSIRKQGEAKDLIVLAGAEGAPDTTSRMLARLIRRLPLDKDGGLPKSVQTISTSSGVYEIALSGDVRGVDRSLGVVAARVAWFVGAMLLALFLAWFIIEIGIIRRIAVLTRRAKNLSQVVKGSGGLERFDVSDLRGADELGILAACLHDLLRRVKEDVEREEIRAEQEKEMWHAVGHEIMSPLQSLMALHAEGQSSRYINRMQQAIRVLYGSASPSEAFQSTVLQVTSVELDAFLKNVADNAPLVGIADVRFTNESGPVAVRADDYSLEDVVTHVLRNAERYRTAGTPIEIVLRASETSATITIANQGPNIAEDMLGKIFEYGVSDQQDSAAEGNRGQGLFVAKTYMAKMGGTIAAQNLPDGVVFTLSLQRSLQ